MTKSKSFPLSEQLRNHIEKSGMSRYQLAKESGVDAGQLCRFMKGKVQLTFETLDRLGIVLGLELCCKTPNRNQNTTLKSIQVKQRKK